MGNRWQRSSLFDGSRLSWGGPICSVLADFWGFACTILVWSFAESTDYVRKFLSLILVNFVVVTQRRFPWMARDFTVDMARLTGFLQFVDECFSHVAVRKTFIHCFVEREVVLFAATDLSSSISSFETTGNLETSAALSYCVVVVVVVVFRLVPVDSKTCGTAAIFGEKSATIWLKLTAKVGKSSASYSSASRRSCHRF